MKKKVLLSLLSASLLFSQDIELQSIEVDASVIDDVAKNAKVNADISEVIQKETPAVDMSRRSGIANDIIIRGLKRDNISVTLDGAKVYGACPNRMDPPVSHVLSNNIQSVEVIEGPYDVTEYGNLGGGVKIKTLQPQKGWHGDVSFGGGSWNYKKLSGMFTGGDDFMRVLVAASSEDSNQYKDGNGDTLAAQIDKRADTKYQYSPKYHDKEAYTKRSFMTKVALNPIQNQELRLSYTANRSENVLYPNSPMDALYDDSDIYNIEYEFKNITPWYKSATMQYYKTKVDHPMANYYRKSAMMMKTLNHMYSSMDAVRFKNRFVFGGIKTDFGLEAGKRNWDGDYTINTTSLKSLDDVDTKNYSVYLKLSKKIDAWDISAGARYDRSKIHPQTDATLPDNDYNSVGANIFANYALNNENKLFFGIGQAQRVPDARELYFKDKQGGVVGTPNLDQVTNREADAGYKYEGEDVDVKLKAFYSDLKNYIYINSSKTTNIFENVNAYIYGAELKGSYYLSDEFTLEAQGAYKRGRKKDALVGQRDKDLADIAPLEGKVGVVWDYRAHSYARVDISARDRWKNYDADNGEQEISGWAVVDFKLKHNFKKGIDMTVGVNNILDKTYVRSNTYKDLTLVTTGGGEVVMLNEPGRYIYANFDLSF